MDSGLNLVICIFDNLLFVGSVEALRDYQRKKNNPYILPKNLYRRMLWLVRDYDRLKDEWESILHESPTMDGQPRGSGTSDPTADKAARREKLWVQMEAVDQALMAIPEEYRQGVAHHIKYGVRFPDYAHFNTWKKWQARFIYHVAKRLGEI